MARCQIPSADQWQTLVSNFLFLCNFKHRLFSQPYTVYRAVKAGVNLGRCHFTYCVDLEIVVWTPTLALLLSMKNRNNQLVHIVYTSFIMRWIAQRQPPALLKQALRVWLIMWQLLAVLYWKVKNLRITNMSASYCQGNLKLVLGLLEMFLTLTHGKPS